jgi:hypothetical protein
VRLLGISISNLDNQDNNEEIDIMMSIQLKFDFYNEYYLSL